MWQLGPSLHATSIVTLIFGTGDVVRGLLRSSHGLTRYCSTGEIGPLLSRGETPFFIILLEDHIWSNYHSDMGIMELLYSGWPKTDTFSKILYFSKILLFSKILIFYNSEKIYGPRATSYTQFLGNSNFLDSIGIKFESDHSWESTLNNKFEKRSIIVLTLGHLFVFTICWIFADAAKKSVQKLTNFCEFYGT